MEEQPDINIQDYGILFTLKEKEREKQIEVSKNIISELNKQGDIDTEYILLQMYKWFSIQNNIVSLQNDMNIIEYNNIHNIN